MAACPQSIGRARDQPRLNAPLLLPVQKGASDSYQTWTKLLRHDSLTVLSRFLTKARFEGNYSMEAETTQNTSVPRAQEGDSQRNGWGRPMPARPTITAVSESKHPTA